MEITDNIIKSWMSYHYGTPGLGQILEFRDAKAPRLVAYVSEFYNV